MRLLFAIPHFFDAKGGGGHGSLARDPEPRIAALTACISSLRQTFGTSQHSLNIERRIAEDANQTGRNDIDIVVCTTRGRHVLDQLPLAADSFTHVATDAEPMLLGFECQRILRDRLGAYDYYCFLEDDLSLNDPWFFSKLAWFDSLMGSAALLQPNRYEVAVNNVTLKLYVDGDIRADLTARFQNRSENPEAIGKLMGKPIRFVRPANPHSGCYFLTGEQMAHWAAQPHFLDGDTSFIGPLESAATLGIMRTFHIYKPAPEVASFLEVRHAGTGFLRLVGKRIPFAVAQASASGNEPVSAVSRNPSRTEAPRTPYRLGWDAFLDIERLSEVWHYPIEVVFDVGANDGQTALRALDRFRNCRVIAFEPHPKTVLELTERMKANPRVEVVNLALGSEPCERTMFEYDDSHINSLAANAQFAVRFGKVANSIVVNCTTVDQFCVERGIDRIDVLKIDTEGFDHEVVKGTQGLIAQRAVRFIYFEFNTIQPKPGTTGGALAPIDDLIQPHGYRFIATYNDYVVAAGEPFIVSNALYALPPQS